jgi:hypothetical protein
MLVVVSATAAMVLAGLRRAACGPAVHWGVPIVLLTELLLALTGVLQQWERRPPPFLVMVGVCLALVTVLVVWCRSLTDLPFAWLIGAQAFRLPLELVMHRAATTGVMPGVMSYSGRNFDIVTGASAIVVAYLAARNQAPRWLLWAWNLMGTALLINVVTVAALATPVFRAFGESQLNTWVAYAPFVWLPGFLVPVAAMGHALVWRKLAGK